ncbi:MAG: thiamine biosynthesis protein [Candidatus Latescibacter sp.]|nr:thiamine biosynthesis protein [Candidatus Latescibacter sp.]
MNNKKSDQKKVIGMFSGGLDSILAAKIMALEGFEVIALHFYTGFSGLLSREVENGPFWKWEPAPEVVEAAQTVGVTLRPVDVSGNEYLDMLANPRYGYGSAANPCIDCRAFLLARAREIMEKEGAILVFTGEVLGQRPMSQNKPAMELVMKKSGLEGRLLRPLSARLLEPTIPEKDGSVNRENLHSFHGRSRKPQKALAAALGIEKYPQSGGGCLLTDPGFGARALDLYAHLDSGRLTMRDMNSLKAGRHLRLPGGIKVIVGRNERENNYLAELFVSESWIFEARDFPGASVFAPDDMVEGDFLRIAAIAARYGKGNDQEQVAVTVRRGETIQELTVRPALHEEIEPLMIREKL